MSHHAEGAAIGRAEIAAREMVAAIDDGMKAASDMCAAGKSIGVVPPIALAPSELAIRYSRLLSAVLTPIRSSADPGTRGDGCS